MWEGTLRARQGLKIQDKRLSNQERQKCRPKLDNHRVVFEKWFENKQLQSSVQNVIEGRYRVMNEKRYYDELEIQEVIVRKHQNNKNINT